LVHGGGQYQDGARRSSVGAPRQKEVPIVPYGLELETRQLRHSENSLAIRWHKQGIRGEANSATMLQPQRSSQSSVLRGRPIVARPLDAIWITGQLMERNARIQSNQEPRDHCSFLDAPETSDAEKAGIELESPRAYGSKHLYRHLLS
jgi:hypothetical protein